ncbi:alpha/beta fold hydrolase [Terricaulis sp.]|uniref:alpha/beta fold hydrolase n=1 Tax=Terricaulis sp. TaxID=2768686 RepID=UPI002AC72A8F|nr:alpha/beta fold hydrolase [Terricaulis sp.]MDZ4691731.1 alpha/beta fold hydrolase [Terricaulis sp.]
MAEAQSLVRTRRVTGVAAQSFLGLALLVLAACVPTVQRAGPRADLTQPRFEPTAERFISFDGAELGLTAWLPPEGQEPRAVIIGLHGMNDYANTFYLAGPWFAEHGVALYAYDARGFGRSPNRGVWAGERLMTEDLRTAIAVARRAHPNTRIAVVGDSMGAATAIATFGDENAPQVDRVVLVAPAVWGWSTLPDHYALTLWLGAHTFPWRAVQPPRNVVRTRTASDNQEALLQAGRAPHMIWSTRIDAVYGLVSLMERATERSANLRGDVLFLYGANDQIIPRNSAIAAARRLPASVRTAYYENGWHWLLRDRQREVVYADILAFIEDAEAPLPSAAPPLLARAQANR